MTTGGKIREQNIEPADVEYGLVVDEEGDPVVLHGAVGRQHSVVRFNNCSRNLNENSVVCCTYSVHLLALVVKCWFLASSLFLNSEFQNSLHKCNFPMNHNVVYILTTNQHLEGPLSNLLYRDKYSCLN